MEFNCPEHGLERSLIKILKKHNLKDGKILPVVYFKNSNELKRLEVGSKVTYEDIKKYLKGYLEEKGLLDQVLRIDIV